MEPEVEVELTEEDQIRQRIKTADIAARVLIFASILFIGGGASVRIMRDASLGNSIMFTGLVFVALFGVAAYVKKELEKKLDAGKTFHGG